MSMADIKKQKQTASYGSVSFADNVEYDDNGPSSTQQQQAQEIQPLQPSAENRRSYSLQEESSHSLRLPRKQFEDRGKAAFQQYQRHHSDPIPTRDNTVSVSMSSSSLRRPLSENSDPNDKGGIFPSFHHHWLPDVYETDFVDGYRYRYNRQPVTRSLKRRMFLFLTEPTTSIGSALFFFVLILAIAVMNILMIMQTMNHWQFTPSDCITCGGTTEYIFEDDAIEAPLEPSVPCVCPPTPVEWTNTCLTYLVYFFTVEWTLRVAMFEPPKDADETFWKLWFAHVTETTTILDALAIFPYYLETLDNTNGLMSLRLLRLFRVFQLFRLGQYNTTFLSLTTVLFQSLLYLKLLVIALIFGAAMFGSLLYWLEKGSWKYHEETGQYRFLRVSVDGVTEEPSPFTSIPAAFWWFIVTATTCGYGDVYPTTTGGKWVAAFAMLTGVLVVAFPVSVFSDLWSREVSRINKRHGIVDETVAPGASDDNDDLFQASGHRDDTNTDIYFNTKAKDVETLLSSMHITRSSSPPPLGTDNGIADISTSPGSHRTTNSPILEQEHGKDVVIMKQKDLADIVNNLETIRESEFRIRSILNKYEIQTT